MLPEEDLQYLKANHPSYLLQIESNSICVLIPGFPLPKGYSLAQSDLLLVLSSLYPDARPDMWWFDPPAVRADGQVIPQTEATGQYLGRTWQRWSRHLDESQWLSGIDNLQSYLALVRSETLLAVADVA